MQVGMKNNGFPNKTYFVRGTGSKGLAEPVAHSKALAEPAAHKF
jgi:hypothetical protein